MKTLTKKEWEEEYQDVGQSFFMGGFNSDSPSCCVHAEDQIVFFSEDDMKAIKKYRELMEIQRKESEEYTKGLENG